MLAPGSPGYRILKIAVVAMGVLIVIGTVALAILASGRLGGGAGGAVAVTTLDEPAGTRIVGIAAAGKRLAVHVTGGGREDRVLLVDPDRMAVVGRLAVGP